MYRPPILDEIEDYGFVVFDSCDYDLNIIAVRNLGNHPNGNAHFITHVPEHLCQKVSQGEPDH